MIGIFTALSQSNISVHSVDGLIQKTQVFGQAGFQSGSFPFSTRLRRLYSLSTVKTLRRTRTIPPATQATENSQEKWLLDFNNEPINWKLSYILPFQCTNSRNLIEFQFKLLHRQISKNTFLTKIGLKDNEKCTFCQKVPEIHVIIHIFWSCDLASSFWKRVTEWLQNINVISQTDNIDRMTALGLRPDQSKFSLTVNLCCLLTRYYIWICKSKESFPNMNNFLFFVKSQYKLDAKGKAEKKWEPLAAYIQSMN